MGEPSGFPDRIVCCAGVACNDIATRLDVEYRDVDGTFLRVPLCDACWCPLPGELHVDRPVCHGDNLLAIAAEGTAMAEDEWRQHLPRCEATGCVRLADWAYVGAGGDMYVCSLCGGTEAVDGWQWIGE